MAEELTLAELQKKIAELQAKEQEIIQAEKATVVEEIKAKIAQYKLSFEDLGFKAPVVAMPEKSSNKGKSNTTLVPIYRNKNNHAETWHGSKGRLPLWLQAILKELQKTKPEAGNPELKQWLYENGYKIEANQ
ncbi:MAG: H-NS histone family protein [Delftia acidovorans]|uniref:H-NS histone family protein n=1 Tax=Delftia acidovorans TaxID=80866 RepID=A0A7T2S515_DELAC|nr:MULTISPECIES: H-NS histone family protein [Delftia]MBL8356118.1 H-NS histone family protein [Delftia acidovorans]QPS09079.1 H-NS histone family protein [Delftia acidovorans]